MLGSLAASKDFGRQMAREAKRRRFWEALARAFLGDGLPWNWSIWKQHFPDFTAILDFIHVLSYLFLAAKAVHDVAADAWDQYLVWMRGAWQGEVAQVLDELRAWQTRLGAPPEGVPDQDPRKVLAKTVTYLENNRAADELPGLSPRGSAGDDGVDGVAGQGDELPGQRDGDVLERPGGGRGDPAGACRGAVRR